MKRGAPYNPSRAAVEEMKKTTALPYQMGFFAFLNFLPTFCSVRTGGGKINL
ncbi:hypothetical protein HPP92_015763 [Vanilla planifolia]|uniref:Uncharacterized protein n=1 Tax=Vanilla planifolia TaxID=51239 RepID=A0A835URE9_VANPL|nr:hypothetical protein HPP92_015763 [Vanilla planifolia]